MNSIYILNYSGGTTGLSVRKETLNGKQYLVAPAVLIVSGVLNGSKGALYYPPEECSNNVDAWNHVPLTIYHPHHLGQNVSARHPEVLSKQGVGFIRGTAYSNNKLRAEAWFDVSALKRVNKEIYNRLSKGDRIELSTGLYTDNHPAQPGSHHNGVPYEYVARNYRADHVAVLPDQVGACSIRDGCGVLVNTLNTIVSNSSATDASAAAHQASLEARASTKSILDNVQGGYKKSYYNNGPYQAQTNSTNATRRASAALKAAKSSNQESAIDHHLAAKEHHNKAAQGIRNFIDYIEVPHRGISYEGMKPGERFSGDILKTRENWAGSMDKWREAERNHQIAGSLHHDAALEHGHNPPGESTTNTDYDTERRRAFRHTREANNASTYAASVDTPEAHRNAARLHSVARESHYRASREGDPIRGGGEIENRPNRENKGNTTEQEWHDFDTHGTQYAYHDGRMDEHLIRAHRLESGTHNMSRHKDTNPTINTLTESQERAYEITDEADRATEQAVSHRHDSPVGSDASLRARNISFQTVLHAQGGESKEAATKHLEVSQLHERARDVSSNPVVKEAHNKAATLHHIAHDAHTDAITNQYTPTINPFVNRDQQKACYAKDDPDWDCDKWSKETKSKKSKDKKSKRTDNMLSEAKRQALSVSHEAHNHTIEASTTHADTEGGYSHPSHEASLFSSSAKFAAERGDSLYANYYHGRAAHYHEKAASEATNDAVKQAHQRAAVSHRIASDAHTDIDSGDASKPDRGILNRLWKSTKSTLNTFIGGKWHRSGSGSSDVSDASNAAVRATVRAKNATSAATQGDVTQPGTGGNLNTTAHVAHVHASMAQEYGRNINGSTQAVKRHEHAILAHQETAQGHEEHAALLTGDHPETVAQRGLHEEASKAHEEAEQVHRDAISEHADRGKIPGWTHEASSASHSAEQATQRAIHASGVASGSIEGLNPQDHPSAHHSEVAAQHRGFGVGVIAAHYHEMAADAHDNAAQYHATMSRTDVDNHYHAYIAHSDASDAHRKAAQAISSLTTNTADPEIRQATEGALQASNIAHQASQHAVERGSSPYTRIRSEQANAGARLAKRYSDRHADDIALRYHEEAHLKHLDTAELHRLSATGDNPPSYADADNRADSAHEEAAHLHKEAAAHYNDAGVAKWSNESLQASHEAHQATQSANQATHALYPNDEDKPTGAIRAQEHSDKANEHRGFGSGIIVRHYHEQAAREHDRARRSHSLSAGMFDTNVDHVHAADRHSLAAHNHRLASRAIGEQLGYSIHNTTTLNAYEDTARQAREHSEVAGELTNIASIPEGTAEQHEQAANAHGRARDSQNKAAYEAGDNGLDSQHRANARFHHDMVYGHKLMTEDVRKGNPWGGGTTLYNNDTTTTNAYEDTARLAQRATYEANQADEELEEGNENQERSASLHSRARDLHLQASKEAPTPNLRARHQLSASAHHQETYLAKMSSEDIRKGGYGGQTIMPRLHSTHNEWTSSSRDIVNAAHEASHEAYKASKGTKHTAAINIARTARLHSEMALHTTHKGHSGISEGNLDEVRAAESHNDAMYAHIAASKMHDQIITKNPTSPDVDAHRNASTLHRHAALLHNDAAEELGMGESPTIHNISIPNSHLYHPAHEASKDAAKASLLTEDDTCFDKAYVALHRSHDNNSKMASRYHRKAAELHESEATKARRDGVEQQAEMHDIAGQAHRKAASVHQSMLTNAGPLGVPDADTPGTARFAMYQKGTLASQKAQSATAAAYRVAGSAAKFAEGNTAAHHANESAHVGDSEFAAAHHHAMAQEHLAVSKKATDPKEAAAHKDAFNAHMAAHAEHSAILKHDVKGSESQARHPQAIPLSKHDASTHALASSKLANQHTPDDSVTKRLTAGANQTSEAAHKASVSGDSTKAVKQHNLAATAHGNLARHATMLGNATVAAAHHMAMLHHQAAARAHGGRLAGNKRYTTNSSAHEDARALSLTALEHSQEAHHLNYDNHRSSEAHNYAHIAYVRSDEGNHKEAARLHGEAARSHYLAARSVTDENEREAHNKAMSTHRIAHDANIDAITTNTRGYSSQDLQDLSLAAHGDTEKAEQATKRTNMGGSSGKPSKEGEVIAGRAIITSLNASTSPSHSLAAIHHSRTADAHDDGIKYHHSRMAEIGLVSPEYTLHKLAAERHSDASLSHRVASHAHGIEAIKSKVSGKDSQPKKGDNRSKK